MGLNRLSPFFNNLLAQADKIKHNGDRSYYMIAFIKLIEELIHYISSGSGTEAKTNSWLQQSIEFMQKHFAEGIQVRDAADYVGIDRAHFTKTFASKTGLTPVNSYETSN